jgi:hypothetical protein
MSWNYHVFPVYSSFVWFHLMPISYCPNSNLMSNIYLTIALLQQFIVKCVFLEIIVKKYLQNVCTSVFKYLSFILQFCHDTRVRLYYIFRATTNRKLKETVALELSFVNSNLQLLKEQLAELNSSVELYQNDR